MGSTRSEEDSYERDRDGDGDDDSSGGLSIRSVSPTITVQDKRRSSLVRPPSDMDGGGSASMFTKAKSVRQFSLAKPPRLVTAHSMPTTAEGAGESEEADSPRARLFTKPNEGAAQTARGETGGDVFDSSEVNLDLTDMLNCSFESLHDSEDQGGTVGAESSTPSNKPHPEVISTAQSDEFDVSKMVFTASPRAPGTPGETASAAPSSSEADEIDVSEMTFTTSSLRPSLDPPSSGESISSAPIGTTYTIKQYHYLCYDIFC